MVIPTPDFIPKAEAAMKEFDKARWVPPPEIQAALEGEIKALHAAGELVKAYETSPFANERNEIIGRIASKNLAQRFRGKVIAFKADLGDVQPCRFYLRVGRNHDDVMRQPEASWDLNLDLLKPHEEWVRVPDIAKSEPVKAKPTPKTDSNSTAKKRMLAKGRQS